MSNVRFIGLDVHAETIAVAVAEQHGEVRSLGIIPNRPESVRKLMKKLGPAAHLRVCYEAGPTGYVLYWQLTALEVKCEVVAPTLVPVKAGDRVKTDRRNAVKLARSYRAGDLTPVWAPTRGTKPCAISFARGRRPRRINCGRAIGWANFCGGMGAARRPR
jgi:transposase